MIEIPVSELMPTDIGQRAIVAVAGVATGGVLKNISAYGSRVYTRILGNETKKYELKSVRLAVITDNGLDVDLGNVPPDFLIQVEREVGGQ